jgi:SSS family solute:Na+ symporter
MFYSFFAPPFSALFLLGSLWRRINGKGALAAIVLGFAWAIGLKVYTELAAEPWRYLTTFPIQALSTWGLSMVVCIVASLMTAPPRPEQVAEDMTFDLKSMNIRSGLGTHWYYSVTLWWALSVILMFVLILIFGVWL